MKMGLICDDQIEVFKNGLNRRSRNAIQNRDPLGMQQETGGSPHTKKCSAVKAKKVP